MTLLKDLSLLTSTHPWVALVAVGLAVSTVILMVSLVAQRRPKAAITGCVLAGMLMLGGFFGFSNVETITASARREVHAARDHLFAQRDQIQQTRAELRRLRATTTENKEKMLEELDLAHEQIDAKMEELATRAELYGHEPPAPPDVPRHHVFVQPPQPPIPPDGRGLLLNLLSGALIAAFLGIGYIALDAGTRGHFTWSLRILTVLAFALLWALTAALW